MSGKLQLKLSQVPPEQVLPTQGGNVHNSPGDARAGTAIILRCYGGVFLIELWAEILALDSLTQATRFFERLGSDYDQAIRRCVPRYAEMLWAIVSYLPGHFRPARILELGCGTGNLSAALLAAFPDAECTLVDLSSDFLAQCRQRFAGSKRIAYQQADFRELNCNPASYDLVASSIAIHHLPDPEKARLFQKVYAWLSGDGVLVYSDQFAGATPGLYQRHLDYWQAEAARLGVSQEEWEQWMRHQEESDRHASLPDQMSWLRDAGFASVDCTWRFLLWTVVQAEK